MDVNETKFHLLLGYDDWANCTDARGQLLSQAWCESPPQENTADLSWDPERHEIILQPLVFRFKAAPKDKPPKLENRRGAACDRYGNWYWIAASREEILVNSSGSRTTAHFWSAGDAISCKADSNLGDFQPEATQEASTPLQFSGLAITEDHYLVVGVLAPAGILIFDLHAGGAPQQRLWPEEIEFVPFDIASKPGGGVWILDRDHKRYWALDRHLNVINQDQSAINLEAEPAEDFQPVAEAIPEWKRARTFPTGITLEAASPLAIHDPIAIESLPDDTVLILDHDPDQAFSRVYHFYYGKQLGSPVSTELILDLVEADLKPGFRLIGHDFAFVPEHTASESQVADRLYIVAADGNQAFAFNISRSNDQLYLQPVAEYFPMRLFGGKGLVTAGSQAYYDSGDQWAPLVKQVRPRFVTDAILYTKAFDGHAPNCIWHRLMLEGCLTPGTEVKIWSRTGNTKKELEIAGWQPEPNLYRRGTGSEFPFTPKITRKNYGTWELLFQRANGQFIQLKLLLHGDGRTTPHLRALRAYYPRFSYSEHYLPAVYREDSQSASFLDRFLANLEGLYTEIEDKIAAVQMLFDVRCVPADALEWLASWFGIALDPCWDEDRRRLFITHIMEFFQYRGTITGLLMALHLAFDRCADESIFTRAAELPTRLANIRIQETYRTRPLPAVVRAEPTEFIGPRQVSATEPWEPLTGSTELHRRYKEFMQSDTKKINFPIQAPTDLEVKKSWQQFARNTLGFIPAITEDDTKSWQNFLRRRYLDLEKLNATWDRNFKSFAEISLPQALPSDFWELRDWYEFEGIALATQQRAHHFSVLLGVPRSVTVSTDTYQDCRDLAERIVKLEKPAHTTFNVQFFWALFRVGQVRLGYDTVLDLGSRAPELLPPMIVNQSYLAEGLLAPGHPQDVSERQILGRDHLTS